MKRNDATPQSCSKALIKALDNIVSICIEIEERIYSINKSSILPVSGCHEVIQHRATQALIQARSIAEKLAGSIPSDAQELAKLDDDLIEIFSSAVRAKLALKKPGKRKELRLYYSFAEMVKSCLDAEIHLTKMQSLLQEGEQ